MLKASLRQNGKVDNRLDEEGKQRGISHYVPQLLEQIQRQSEITTLKIELNGYYQYDKEASAYQDRTRLFRL